MTVPGAGRRPPEGAATPRGLLAQVGGPLGVAESVVPTLVFVVLYQVAAIRAAPDPLPRSALLPIVLVPVVLCVLLVLYRLLRRQSVRTAAGGAVVVGISAALTLISGDANANYLPGFAINAVYLVALVVSLLVRRPLIGVVVGAVLRDRVPGGNPLGGRLSVALTLLWSVLFAVRLAVEMPLYLAGDQVVALGIARIVLGLPLYAAVLLVTVLAVQGAGGPRRGGTGTPAPGTAAGGDIVTEGSARDSRDEGPGTKGV